MPMITEAREAFEQYVQELQDDYLSWYQDAHRRNFALWQTAQLTAMLASFGAAVLAALMKQSEFNDPFWRTLLVVLPLIASLAATLLGQMRPRELMLVRETGREAIQNLIAEARAVYPDICNDAAAICEYHKKLVERVSAIEQTQSSEFAKVSAVQPAK